MYHLAKKNLYLKNFLSSQEIKILDDHVATNTRKIFIYFDDNKKDNLFLIVKEKVKIFLYYPRYNLYFELK